MFPFNIVWLILLIVTICCLLGLLIRHKCYKWLLANTVLAIIILISFELLLLSININFISASIFIDDLQGQIISLSVPTVAASESALGLALSIVYYRLRGGISLDPINSSKS